MEEIYFNLLLPSKQGIFNLAGLEMNNSKSEVLTQKPSKPTTPSAIPFQVLGSIKKFAGPHHHTSSTYRA